MAAIDEDIMEALRGAFAFQQFVTMTGEYDGANGSVSMTFNGDPTTYTVEFEYLGAIVAEFRDLLFRVSGEVVKQYHQAHQPTRDDFIETVTD